jgi:acetyl esterase/lipase
MNHPPTDEQKFPLWPDLAPGSRGDGTDDVPTLTAYLPTGPATGSAMIVCPGGGYAGLADHEGAPVARWLNDAGITAFVLRYRLPGRGYRHPTPLTDAQRAIRLVRLQAKEWDLDPARIGILGFSAGGHLTATASTLFNTKSESGDPVDSISARPDLSILLYAVITFTEPHTHKGSRSNLLGQEITLERIDHLSPEKHITADTPPAFLFHTVADPGVDVENSLLYAAALRKAKVPFEMHLFERGHHGVGLATNDPVLSAWPKLCAAWLKSRGF